jgi:tRNA(Ile2) C34 agmatinyltransferase TiaS
MKTESGSGEAGGTKSQGLGETTIETTKTTDWSEATPEGVVCPACWGELRAEGKALVCAACGRKYPVVDGIPVLIVERAEQS